VKNITLTLPDALIVQAKVLAAHRATSVSGLVGELLESAVGVLDDYDTAWARETALMREGLLTVGERTWTREDLHSRGEARGEAEASPR
jgi:hypothetical protein